MDLIQLQYFISVARLEHFTRAAEELYVAQSSVSRAIARLEEELGVPLFDKKGRQVHLNRFGQAFLQKVERAFKELEEGRRELEDMSRPEQGQVVLAILPSIASQILPKLLIDFREKYPEISFRFHQDSAAQMLDKMEQGDIDLCITMVDKKRSSLKWVELMTEEMFLGVPPVHRLAQRTKVLLNEVAEEPFICLKRGHGVRDIGDNLCRQAGFEPKIVFEGEEIGTVRSLVAAGLGVAFFPEMVLQNLEEPMPVPLHVEEPVCRRIIGLAWTENRYMSGAVRLFRDAVIDYYQTKANVQ